MQLDTPDETGATKRQMHERAVRKGDALPELAAKSRQALEPVVIPRRIEHLKELFSILHRERTHTVISGLDKTVRLPDPLRGHDIEVQARLQKRAITPWEVETLGLMDYVYLKESAKLRG